MTHSVIKQYVTFFDGPYYENFEKLYKGVIVVVDNEYSLACNQVCCIHQVLVNGDAAHVVQVGFRNSCAVNLRF